MKAFSKQLSISPELPGDPFLVSVLEFIDRLLREAKIPYMLVGARLGTCSFIRCLAAR